MKIVIKNMVCPCCKSVVKSEMKNLGIVYHTMESNEIELQESISEEKMVQLETALKPFGLELIRDKKNRLIEKIKIIISDLVNSNDEELKINLSDYISQKINHNYNYLNFVFKEVTGTTIDKYFIIKKIDRVKELLCTHEMNISEIAYMMQYSSVAHLSMQFKKVTGLQPSYFKQFRYKRVGAQVSA